VAEIQTAEATDDKKWDFIKKSNGREVIGKDEKDFKYVFGAVLIPGVVDRQGDVISSEEIEKCAHDFMEHFRTVGAAHTEMLSSEEGSYVESYVAKVDTTFGEEMYPEGTWFVGAKVYDPEAIEMINKGEWNAFSIGGKGERIAVEST